MANSKTPVAMPLPTESAPCRVHIRWLIRRDMEHALSIEKRSAALAARAGEDREPMTEEELLHHLRQRNCIGMVAESGQDVVGFMVYELGKRDLRILNLAVDPDLRRRDIGSQLIAKLVSKLSDHRRTRILADVRETALAFQLFLKAQGFRATRVERRAFPDTREDAFCMEYAMRRPGPVPESEEGMPVNRIQWAPPTEK